MRDRASFGNLQAIAGSGVILAVVTVAGIGCAADEVRVASEQGNQKIDDETIRKVVMRALPLLVKASAQEYPKHRECFSCHNQAVPAVALDLAKKRGFDIGALTLRSIAEHTESDLSGALDDYRKGQGQPGGVIRAGYALWALEAGGWAPDETTSGVAHYLSVVQSDRKRWPPRANRPPSESSAFTATALALRGLRAFGPTKSGDFAGREISARHGNRGRAARSGLAVARENEAHGNGRPRLPALGTEGCWCFGRVARCCRVRSMAYATDGRWLESARRAR